MIAGGLTFVSGENYMRFLQEKLLKLKHAWHLPHNLEAWYYGLVDKGLAPIPRLANVDIRQLALSPALDLAMFGAGGLMGIRAASSMLLGMLINFVSKPAMIAIGEILPKSGSLADGPPFGAHLLNTWALWWGISIMVVASMVSLFANPKVFTEAIRMIRGGGKKAGAAEKSKDVLGHIELPLKGSFVGIPIVGAVGVWMAHDWFGVHWVFGAMAIPLIVVLTLIAASSTALTGITPTGSLSKIPQFLFGGLDPRHPPTNLMTGVMCVEVASNASTFDGHQARLHARRASRGTGDRPLHRHSRRRASIHALLRAVSLGLPAGLGHQAAMAGRRAVQLSVRSGRACRIRNVARKRGRGRLTQSIAI